MADIIDRLEERAVSYEQSGPSAHHTASMLREAKNEIKRLRQQITHLEDLVTGYRNLSR